VKESVSSDRIGFIIEGLLNTKFPAAIERLTVILEERKKDLENERSLTSTIDELKRIYEPTWNDPNILRKKLSSILSDQRVKLPTF
jgi:hypothetical protein